MKPAPVEDTATAPVETLGADLECHEQFPERIECGLYAGVKSSGDSVACV